MIIKYMLEETKQIVQQVFPESIIRFVQNKAIYAPRVKHLNLGAVEGQTPLFDSVFFEVRTRCNGTCSFCPASVQNDTREDRNMSKELYERIIKELKSIKFSGRIAYHMHSDPLIFPHLTDFVNYARQNLPNAWIQILTNGKVLTLKKAEDLLTAGINELSINYYNDDLTANLPKVFQEIRNNLLLKYYKHEQIKTGHGFGTTLHGRIFRFNVIRRKANEILTSRAGNSPNKKEKSKWARGFCEFPFTQLNITADGGVSKCCADFNCSDPMGNVNEKSLIDIWIGEKFEKVRQLLLKGNRDAIVTCKKCDFMGSKRTYTSFGKFIDILTR